MTEWISVKDRLPDYNTEVLATTLGEPYMWVAERWIDNYGTYHFNPTICTCCNMNSLFYATHWMELPGAPNGMD